MRELVFLEEAHRHAKVVLAEEEHIHARDSGDLLHLRNRQANSEMLRQGRHRYGEQADIDLGGRWVRLSARHGKLTKLGKHS